MAVGKRDWSSVSGRAGQEPEIKVRGFEWTVLIQACDAD